MFAYSIFVSGEIWWIENVVLQALLGFIPLFKYWLSIAYLIKMPEVRHPILSISILKIIISDLKNYWVIPAEEYCHREKIIIPSNFLSSPSNFHHPREFLTIPFKFSYSPINFHFHRKKIIFTVYFWQSPSNFQYHREIFIFTGKFSSSPRNFHRFRNFCSHFTAVT